MAIKKILVSSSKEEINKTQKFISENKYSDNFKKSQVNVVMRSVIKSGFSSANNFFRYNIPEITLSSASFLLLMYFSEEINKKKVILGILIAICAYVFVRFLCKKTRNAEVFIENIGNKVIDQLNQNTQSFFNSLREECKEMRTDVRQLSHKVIDQSAQVVENVGNKAIEEFSKKIDFSIKADINTDLINKNTQSLINGVQESCKEMQTVVENLGNKAIDEFKKRIDVSIKTDIKEINLNNTIGAQFRVGKLFGKG